MAGAYHYSEYHNLVMRFNRQRLTLSLLDPFQSRNHFSLRPGLLLKYLEGKRRGAKRTLPLKLLLIRFLRKLLLVSQVRSVRLFVKGVPLHFTQLFTFLNRPLPYTLFDPVTRRTIDETGDSYLKLTYHLLFFTKSKPYGYQKLRKRGRVKRKIRRKVISSARVIDEL